MKNNISCKIYICIALAAIGSTWLVDSNRPAHCYFTLIQFSYIRVDVSMLIVRLENSSSSSNLTMYYVRES